MVGKVGILGHDVSSVDESGMRGEYPEGPLAYGGHIDVHVCQVEVPAKRDHPGLHFPLPGAQEKVPELLIERSGVGQEGSGQENVTCKKVIGWHPGSLQDKKGYHSGQGSNLARALYCMSSPFSPCLSCQTSLTNCP